LTPPKPTFTERLWKGIAKPFVQEELEKAGKGLPKVEGFLLKNLLFPIVAKLLSPERAIKMFEKEGEKIIKSVENISNEKLFQKVLIPKVFGIEDNSRYYSPAMVLWHLIYVGEAVEKGVVNLSRGEKIDLVVKIENFKPFVEIEEDIPQKFQTFLNNYRANIEENVADLSLSNCHSHPWLGCLNPHKWLVLSAVHQMVHRRQLDKILKLADFRHLD
jgi:hypothetical protein